MKRSACCAAVFVFAALAAGTALAQPWKPDLTGDYLVTGTNPGGGEYAGALKINAVEDVYDVEWAVGESESHLGVGILDGDRFAVAYIESEGDWFGVVVYRVTRDEDGGIALSGSWAGYGGSGELGTETAVRE